MNKQILRLALPSIISNITVPLLGLVDMAIVGHFGDAAYIGAIAVGTMMFNIIYWVFGFLRMGTGGFTAQAYGERNLKEAMLLLSRSLSIACGLALTLILLQTPIEWLTFQLVDSSEEVAHFAKVYFRICIWGAPAVLSLYCFTGWFIGMQNTRIPMVIAITQNIVNIIGSLLFVFVFNWGIEGVASATLIAQYSGIIMAVSFWMIYYSRLKIFLNFRESFSSTAMKRFFSVNSDIFFRTICLVAVTTFFTTTGAKQGDLVLAVNTLLMQLFTLFSYFMDGFAYAGEALTGRFVGAKNKTALRNMIRKLFGWGIALSLLFTLLYLVGGKEFLRLLTNNEDVIRTSADYYYWVLIIPFAGFSAFLWDGVLIGATETRKMLYAMLLASLAFFSLYLLLVATLGNHALWLAFITYLLLRGILQTIWSRPLLKGV
ncbi:MATE family efflux transporter [Massilibacteroides sp.]|uniref:MATE family efflux transporter n=1 Tax=Massilibacteroides sp. TaxID=2034766 RepID=UPI0026273590|nr:MATE family efflux transporter [Massilibacteroides sp.]MDD4516802.1 MATE family efflux transporter [Massilibacteroides sp.]